jgi:hypothetical protein
MADWKKAAQLFNFARAAETREKAFIALKEATQKQLPERGITTPHEENNVEAITLAAAEFDRFLESEAYAHAKLLLAASGKYILLGADTDGYKYYKGWVFDASGPCFKDQFGNFHTSELPPPPETIDAKTTVEVWTKYTNRKANEFMPWLYQELDTIANIVLGEDPTAVPES